MLSLTITVRCVCVAKHVNLSFLVHNFNNTPQTHDSPLIMMRNVFIGISCIESFFSPRFPGMSVRDRVAALEERLRETAAIDDLIDFTIAPNHCLSLQYASPLLPHSSLFHVSVATRCKNTENVLFCGR